MKSRRTKMPQADQEVIHELVKDSQGSVGSVDAGEVAALATAARGLLKGKGVKDLTPARVIAIQQAVMSEKGADPSLAAEQIKKRLERERRGR